MNKESLFIRAIIIPSLPLLVRLFIRPLFLSLPPSSLSPKLFLLPPPATFSLSLSPPPPLLPLSSYAMPPSNRYSSTFSLTLAIPLFLSNSSLSLCATPTNPHSPPPPAPREKHKAQGVRRCMLCMQRYFFHQHRGCSGWLEHRLRHATLIIGVSGRKAESCPHKRRRGRGGGRVGRDTNSKHWFTTSFLQPLRYLVTPQGPENCQLTSFSLMLKQ